MIRSLLKRTKFHRAALPLLAMLLTTTTAWADEVSVSNVNELSNAVMYGVTEDRTITLTGDNKEWTLTQTLGAWANYKITIDLNGHTITSESILYRGYNDTDLTIMDSKGGGSLVYTGGQLTSAIGVNSGGKLTIKSGEISSPNSLAIQNDGTLTITGGTINNSLYGIRNTGIANISNCTITCSEFSVYNDAVSNYSGNYIGNLTIGSGVTLNGDVYNHYNAKINATAKAYVPGAPVKAHSDVDPEDVLPGGSYYASLIDAVNAANNATNDITIKMLDDEDLGIEFVAISNTNHIDGDNTNPIVKVTLDLNGHTVSSAGSIVIKINQGANVEITDLSDEKNGTICGRTKNTTSIENYGTLSVSNINILNTYPVDNTNVTKGIFTHDNSTLTIGSGVSFSNLRYGIYTYYNEEQDPWKARAMTRTVSNEPAKLYFNALPTFESCIYDIELINDIIMDFSKATAPLALVDGQKKITFFHYNPSPVKIFTKDYKRAFTNPTTGVITNPNDIFEYYYGENYGEIYYAFGEAIFSSKNDTHLSVVTSDASGTISNLFGYSEASPDDSNSYLITALNNLENGGTVQLFSDITGATKPYVINKGTVEAPVTLDLNGHTITGDMNIESGSTLILTDSSNGNGHIKGAVTVPLNELQDRLANWSNKVDTIKSTGYCGESNVNDGKDITWTLTKTDGNKIGDNFPLKLTISGTGAMSDFYGSATNYPWDITRSNITEVVMSDGITTIGAAAFQGCSNLASIKISSDVESIRADAFNRCKSLTDITIPAKVASIGDQAFVYCETLKTIHIKRSTAPTLEGNFYGRLYNFDGCNAIQYILTPSAEAMNNYASAKGWSAYADKLGAEGYCGDKNENGGKNVKWSLMPTGKKTQYNELLYALNIDVNPDVENQTNFNMGNADYRNQTNNPWLNMGDFISELNIGEGVTSIAEQAFNSLIIISSVVIPRSIEKIAGSAFGDDSHTCSNLEWVYMKRYDPTAEKKITNLDFFEGKCNTFIGCPELKCIFVDNIDAYNAATSADYWDDDMKAKLRKYKPTLFAAGATNEWATFCADIEYAKPDGCTIYTVSGVNSEQVQVTEVEGDVIPACTPVLIKRAAGKISDDIKAEFSAIVDIDDKGWAFNCDIANYYSYYASGPISAMNTVPYSYMDLQFNYHNDNVSDGSITDYSHFFGNTGSATAKVSYIDIDNEYYSVFALYGDKFLRLDALNGIPANRCIIQVDNDLFYDSDPAATRSLTIGVGGDTTGMEELKNEKIEELNSEWYDLQGRKLGSKPTRKGLYINNGKKIVIK